MKSPPTKLTHRFGRGFSYYTPTNHAHVYNEFDLNVFNVLWRNACSSHHKDPFTWCTTFPTSDQRLGHSLRRC
jgi:hypothetical protein